MSGKVRLLVVICGLLTFGSVGALAAYLITKIIDDKTKQVTIISFGGRGLCKCKAHGLFLSKIFPGWKFAKNSVFLMNGNYFNKEERYMRSVLQVLVVLGIGVAGGYAAGYTKAREVFVEAIAKSVLDKEVSESKKKEGWEPIIPDVMVKKEAQASFLFDIF